MRRLWARLFGPKPYGCGCGKAFRNEDLLAKHTWGHALSE